MPLTHRMRMFCLEYFNDPDRNASRAARNAGYSPLRSDVTGAELLRNSQVQHFLQDMMTRRARTESVTVNSVVTGILETIENARNSGKGAWQTAAQLRGWELLGKYLGIFTDKVELGLDQKVMEMLEAGRQRAAGLIVARVDEDSATEAKPIEEKKEPPKPN